MKKRFFPVCLSLMLCLLLTVSSAFADLSDVTWGMSKGEISSVKNAVGLDAMVDTNDQDYPLFQYLATTEAKLDKLYEVPYLLKTPIVRNGKKATVGYCPEIWKEWE